ncbi:kinase [Verticillium dahliae]
MPFDEIQYPPGFGLKDVVAWGSTGLIVLDAATQTIIKTPFDDEFRPSIQRERLIYERLTELGGHDGILPYHGGVDGGGICLGYASKHDLQSFIQEQNRLDLRLRLRWMIQLAETLDFIHDAGIIHGDLTTSNMLLDDRLNLKLADFAGSSIDLQPLLVTITASHEYPGDLLSTQADIFAVGSAMYEIMTGERPYSSLSEVDTRMRFKNKEFPDIASLGSLGHVIRACWEGSYSNSKALAKDLKAIRDASNTIASDTCLPHILFGIGAIVLAALVYRKLTRTT